MKPESNVKPNALVCDCLQHQIERGCDLGFGYKLIPTYEFQMRYFDDGYPHPARLPQLERKYLISDRFGNAIEGSRWILECEHSEYYKHIMLGVPISGV